MDYLTTKEELFKVIKKVFPEFTDEPPFYKHDTFSTFKSFKLSLIDVDFSVRMKKGSNIVTEITMQVYDKEINMSTKYLKIGYFNKKRFIFNNNNTSENDKMENLDIIKKWMSSQFPVRFRESQLNKLLQ